MTLDLDDKPLRWKLMPADPTPCMVQAAWDTVRSAPPEERMMCELASARESHRFKMIQRYRAMAKHAPAPQIEIEHHVDGIGDHVGWMAHAGPDVQVWCGELSNQTLDEAIDDDDRDGLGPDSSQWITVFDERANSIRVLGKAANAEIGFQMVEAIAVAILAGATFA